MPDSTSDIISMEQAGTLDGLFYERTQHTPDNIAYVQYDRKSDQWIESSWNDMARQVGLWQTALEKEKVQRGDRVAVLMRNCKEWVTFDQASMGHGLVVVPLYVDDRPDNIAYILDDAAVKVLLLQDITHYEYLKESLDQNTHLVRIIVADCKEKTLDTSDPRVTCITNWLPADEESHVLHKRKGDPYELATIVYTSGTTGRPKGVMLSHHNILSVAFLAAEDLGITTTDSVLSFLPLSHTFERTCGYYLTMMCGAKVNYARSIQQLADDLIITKPTAIMSVPRIYERVYAKIRDGLKKSSVVKKSLFKLTTHIGWKRFLYQQGRIKICFSCLLWPILKKLVADKVMSKFGGELRLAVSGGAAMPYDVAKVFLSLGLPLIQGYGLTETSPIASFNRINDNDPRSIGHPLPTVTYKIGDNDELLIKSPGVMMGYWNNHKATKAVIDPDGWFHSGDQARLAPSGRAFITGRIKDILVMSNGEKIPPVDMETAISMDPMFENALIIGEGQAFLGAITVLSSEGWIQLCKDNGLDPLDKSNLTNKKLAKKVQLKVTELLHDFPGYAKVRKVILSLEPWTIDNEMLTPTLKVKRNVVMEAFKDEIKRVYS